MKIGELARKTGLSASSIRYYESERLIPRPSRVGGKRDFGCEVVDLLVFIRVAQRAGFKIREIRTLTKGYLSGESPSGAWRSLATTKLEELEKTIHRARAMQETLSAGLRCKCLSLSECEIRPSRLGRQAVK